MTPLEIKTLFVAMLVGLAHIASGIAVLVNSAALAVTPLASLAWVETYFKLGSATEHGFSGAVLVGAGLMAVVGAGTLTFPGWVRSTLFVPQQTLLLLHIWSISAALFVGHYPDGYIPTGGGWFIIADQVWAWVLCVSHSAYLAAFIAGGLRHGRIR
jgi:hypothetical protein